MQKTKFDFGLVIIVFITSVCSFLMYGDVMLHPDMYMFSNSGDGIKNYFTFAWHIRYDHSWLEYTGSNYPYGEHVGYTDGHPLFSFLFGWIDIVKQHPIGFLNALMVYSPIVASGILYKIFRKLEVSVLLAVVGAFCIVLMQPQLVRMTGHYSLSYSWVIPLFIFLFLNLQNRRVVFQGIIFLLYITAVFFIHPYLGMGLALFACCIWLVQWATKKWSDNQTNFALLFSGVGAVIFYAVFSKLTDTHIDRPTIAKGFLEYKSSLQSVFLPHFGGFREMLPFQNDHWEGFAYVGLFSILIWLAGGYVLIRKWSQNNFFGPAFLLVLASIPILFFSFAWPFSWKLESALKYIPFIEQFRSPGRFSWVFFYTFTIGAVVILDRQLAPLNKVIVKYTIVLCVLLLALFEAMPMQWKVAQDIMAHRNAFDFKWCDGFIKSEVEKVKASNVQAIIPIPFFHYGSDFYAKHGDERIQRLAYLVAYHSGVPLVASSNPRVSISESRHQLNLLEPISTHEISEDLFQKDKPFYILHDDRNGMLDIPREEEQVFLNRSKFSKNYARILSLVELQEDVAKEDSLYKSLVWNKWQEVVRRFSTQMPVSSFAVKSKEFIILDQIEEQEWSADKWYRVEMVITSEDIQNITGLQFIVQQQTSTGEVQWRGMYTAEQTSGLPDNTYIIYGYFNQCIPSAPMQLVVFNNERPDISFEIIEWAVRVVG